MMMMMVMMLLLMMMMMMMMMNCLSTEDDNQLPVCFIATLYQAKMFIVEGHRSAESYIIMSHTTNKVIISKHHNDYYTLQTLELTGKTWCVQHVTNFEHLP